MGLFANKTCRKVRTPAQRRRDDAIVLAAGVISALAMLATVLVTTRPK